MQIAQAKKWIKANLPRLQKRFRLEDWELTVEVSKSIAIEEDPGRLATCHPSCDYQHAWIDIGVDEIVSDKDLEMIICHELLHCVLSPIDQIRDLFSESDNKQAQAIFYKYYYSAIERTVRNLELMLGLGIKTSQIV